MIIKLLGDSFFLYTYHRSANTEIDWIKFKNNQSESQNCYDTDQHITIQMEVLKEPSTNLGKRKERHEW